MRAVSAGRLRGHMLAAFSSPMLVFQAIETPWRLYMPAFLTTHVGLSLVVVASFMFWIRLFDTVIEPALGFASDRSATRFGRRRPFMVASVPLIVTGAALLFFAPAGRAIEGVIAAALLLHLGYIMLVTPHGGWGLELATTPAESTRIMGAKMWAFAAAVPLTLAIPAAVERLYGGGLALQMGMMGLLVMIATPLVVLATVTCVPEPPIAPRKMEWRAFARSLARPDLLRVLLLYALLGAADAAEGAVTLFFIETALGIRGWTGALLLIPALVGLLTIPLWTALGMRLGKRRALVAALALRIMLAPLAWWLPAGEAIWLIAYLLVRALYWGADYLLLRAMVADLVKDWGHRSGEGYAATHYAVFNVSNKLAAAVGVGAAIGLLGLAGFMPGGVAAAGTEPLLRALYAFPSCVAGVLALLVLRRIGPAQHRSDLGDLPAAQRIA